MTGARRPDCTGPMAFKDRLYDLPVMGTAMRVQDRYKEDAGDQFAGAIGFFGFLSLFPLLLLAVSVLGFVLADASNTEIADAAGTIQEAIPGFSAALGGDESAIADALEGVVANRGSVGLIGLVALLLSGMRVVNSAQTGTLVIFRVDLLARSGFRRKVQQFIALVVLGLLALGGVAAASMLTMFERIELLGVMDVLGPILVWVGTYLLDVLLFLVAYRLLGTVDGPRWRGLLPGALLAGLGWTLLKGFGATYVSNQVASASELYGALGGVIGLLLLMYLAGRLYVYGAELSAVRAPDPQHPVAEAGETPTRAPAQSGTSRSDVALDQRQALAIAVGIGALAGLVGVLRPWDTGDH